MAPLILNGGECSASRPGEKAAGTHLTGGRVSSRTSLKASMKEIASLSLP